MEKGVRALLLTAARKNTPIQRPVRLICGREPFLCRSASHRSATHLMTDQTAANRRRTDLQEGRTMLLTNTIQTQTNYTTRACGNVSVCGVEFRGCSACPEHFADRPSEKSAGKRSGDCSQRRADMIRPVMYAGHQRPWQQLWLISPTSSTAAPGLRIGRAFGRSLS